MIPLHGRTTVTRWVTPATDVWQLADPSDPDLAHKALILRPGETTREPAGIYISVDPNQPGPGPTLHVPASLSHLSPGDVIVVADDGSKAHVAWKATAAHNSILLTERCDHYCLMCSQPPKDRDDSYLYQRAKRIVSALPEAAQALSLTGGEPTIDPAAFFDLLEHIATHRPDLSTHILSNGRRFADPAFARRFASIPIPDVMVGIPLYAPEAALHDFIVQAEGAFDDTVGGVMNLAAAGAAIELRIVIQKVNISVLADLALFIARNLPFVNQVVLMGLEMTGLARPNTDLVWVDPHEYRQDLRTAYHLLHRAGIYTRIYNHQLCLIEPELWPAAVQSISDWKNDFPPLCEPCAVRDQCTGIFTTSGTRLSPNLRPIPETEGSVDELVPTSAF